MKKTSLFLTTLSFLFLANDSSAQRRQRPAPFFHAIYDSLIDTSSTVPRKGFNAYDSRTRTMWYSDSLKWIKYLTSDDSLWTRHNLSLFNTALGSVSVASKDSTWYSRFAVIDSSTTDTNRVTIVNEAANSVSEILFREGSGWFGILYDGIQNAMQYYTQGDGGDPYRYLFGISRGNAKGILLNRKVTIANPPREFLDVNLGNIAFSNESGSTGHGLKWPRSTDEYDMDESVWFYRRPDTEEFVIQTNDVPFQFEDAESIFPDIRIVNKNADDLSSRFRFWKQKAIAANDDLGEIYFSGGTTLTEYGLIKGEALTTTSGRVGLSTWQNSIPKEHVGLLGDNGTPGQGQTVFNSQNADIDIIANTTTKDSSLTFDALTGVLKVDSLRVALATADSGEVLMAIDTLGNLTFATVAGGRVYTEGYAIDLTDLGAGNALTIAFDPSEVGTATWADNTSASETWIWSVTGSDPSLRVTSGLFDFSNSGQFDDAFTVNFNKSSAGDFIAHGDNVNDLFHVDASADKVIYDGNEVKTGGASVGGGLSVFSSSLNENLLFNTMNTNHFGLASNVLSIEAEAIEDFIGAMLSGTQTGITVTYDDTNGEIDFVLDQVGIRVEESGVVIGTRGGINFIEGEGIDLVGVDDSGNDEVDFTISGEDASTTNKGIASFTSGQFSVTSGAVSLNESYIEDTVGDMVGSGNTETGIAVTYDGVSDKLDFVVDSPTHRIEESGSVIGTRGGTNYIEGEGINIVGVDDSGNDEVDITLSGEDASTTNKGIASFNSSNFSVSSGEVSILSGQFEQETHASEHESGGNDEIDVSSLLGTLNDAQKVRIEKAGVTTGTQTGINFIDGDGVSITTANDGANNEVDVTIAGAYTEGEGIDIIGNEIKIDMDDVQIFDDIASNYTLGRWTWGGPDGGSGYVSFEFGSIGMEINNLVEFEDRTIMNDVLMNGPVEFKNNTELKFLGSTNSHIKSTTSNDLEIFSNNDIELNTADDITNGAATIYHSASDLRLKKNIKTISGALEKIKKMRGVTFDFKDQSTLARQKRKVGMIAQEVQGAMPELVGVRPDGMLMLEYNHAVGLLVEGIKELSDKIDNKSPVVSRINPIILYIIIGLLVVGMIFLHLQVRGLSKRNMIETRFK